MERRCLTLREDVEHLSESQEVLTDLMVRKKDTQRIAPKDCQIKIFVEFEELEVQRAKEALTLVQKKHKLIKWECERERARTMQRLEASRASGPRSEATTILLVVLAQLPWPSTQTKRCLLGGALTWRVKWRSRR